MQEKFEELRQRAKQELCDVTSSRALFELKSKYLGKNGEVTALLRGLKDVPTEERSSFGKMINDLKVEISSYFDEKENKVKGKCKLKPYKSYFAFEVGEEEN